MKFKVGKISNFKGFTLIELLIVMIILGLLASLVGPAMFGKVDSSKIKTAQAQIQIFETALDTYRLDVGGFPNSLSELRNSENPQWDGPYLKKDVPNDPWGNSYEYKLTNNGSGYLITSFGQDGQPGGEDNNADITN